MTTTGILESREKRMRELPVTTETKEAETTEPRLPPPATLPEPPRPTISPIVFVLAIAAFALHFAGRDRYGFFRDELYYIACGNHLAFGYVDQPPLIAVVARLSSFLLGTTLSAFRFFPALAGVCLVLLTGWMTRELGGRRFAQVLACLAVLLAPIYLAFGSFLSMNAFEPVLWMACACILVRILKGGDARLWLLFGAVAGIGLENKHTMLMFGFGVVTGLILTRDWNKYNSRDDVVFQPRRMSPETLLEGYRYANRRFYSAPSIARRLSRSPVGLWWTLPLNMAYAFALWHRR